ncbi:MAG: leucine-rich repeat protein [Oscillospiraceae bacterium]|nr:leucine-rich repeat protein [Oscillospiraceae bacterium]
MKMNAVKKLWRPALVMLLVMVMVLSMIPVSPVQASNATKSGATINRLDDLKVDYKDYLNNSVMFQLADHIADDQEISVIITVDVPDMLTAYEQGDSTQSFAQYVLNDQEAADIQSQIAGEKAQILQKLDEAGVNYTQGLDYATLLSGFELVIQARDFDITCQSLTDGQGIIVCEEYETADAKVVENAVNFYENTGIFDSSNSGYDGSGMVVAVLDTGLDSSHTAFSTSNFSSAKLGLTYEEVAAVLNKTKAYEQSGGLSVDDVYINEKVPYGYDYADNDPDVYSTHNNHGTHVSGVIVGKDDVITGVAPNAQLVSMKTFSDIMDTARASWILSALEDCVVLGVDVINMSLGTAAGFARETDEEVLSGVYDRIRENGISVVVAASNSYSSAYGSEANGNLGLTSNPDTGTVGSPGTYEGVLSIASIAGEETPYLKYGDTIIYFDEATDAASEEKDFYAALLGDNKSKTYEFIVVPGVGRSVDYTGLNVEGKIALVRRGDNTFEEKAQIAQKQGAAGVIIYNNVSGEIKMNVGDAEIPVCSISQNDGEMLAATGGGKLKLSKEQTAGPFISEFSSWGPTPSLNIKPELTGHGGNILSSVTGGGYDRLSGTSMACPNLAGVVILMRQYVEETFPEIAEDKVKVNEMVNKLLMSTADIALGTNGLPYAVRKQGAGLANLGNAMKTPAFITTYDKEGNKVDKTKLELGDDPQKQGVYEMKFEIENFGDKKVSYTLGSYVLTEGVSETKTAAGKTTVTEEAYSLEAKMEILSVEGGSQSGKKVTVGAGKTAVVTVKIALTDADKAYLTNSFENGMYVEGFITLKAESGTKVDLSIPYLAFFGDWTVAPLFDLTYYDTNADELNDGLNEEDKTKADAYATRPIGGVEADYVSYLGTYYFLQDPKDIVISANPNYVALSNQDGTIHSLRFVWAGLLRNARRIEIEITDDATGEVIFETVDTDVRKSYGDGGSIYPANVEIEFDTKDYNLTNNSTYTVTLTGYLDYNEDGGIDTNKKNTFSFPLTVDFEAPTVSGVEYYFEYDKTNKKNKLFAKVSVYDNHYSMAAQLGYVTMGEDENGNATPELKAFEQYMTPIYSQPDSTTVVTFELTDYLYTLKEDSTNPNTFVLTTYDYALNYATYEIGLPDDFVDFYFENLSEEGLTLSPNEIFTIDPLVYPDTQWSELLEITSSRPSVVRVVNDKLVATGSGQANVKVKDPKTEKEIIFQVKVLKEGDEGYVRYDKPVADTFRLVGYTTLKAYYMVNSEDKLIGDTGDNRFFEGDTSLTLYPSESVGLTYELDAYYPNDTKVVFETSNDSIVTVNDSGVVTAVAEGFASVTVKVMQDDRSTYFSESISIEVKEAYTRTGGSISHYYGLGGHVMIPGDEGYKEIGNFAFANFDYVQKTEEELAFDDAETSKQWYIGDNTITKVTIPEGIEKIGAYAFANLTALEEIILPSTMEFIEYGAFYGCTSLKKVTFSGENNLKVISRSAFEMCDLRETLDLSSICMISPYAFAGNQKLAGVTTGDNLLSIGDYAFAGCKGLETVTITANKVKYGPYVFTGCDALKSFYVNAAVVPEGMFHEAKGLTTVTIGPDVKTIGQYAFRDTGITSYVVENGNTTYKAQTADYIISADGKTLYAVAPKAAGTFTAENIGGATITTIGKGAFSHNNRLESIDLPSVTAIEDYGLSSCDRLTTVNFGTLTTIGDYAFFETLISQLPTITKDTEIRKYAFGFTKLTEVHIPDGAVLAEGVFAQCKDLHTVTIGNDATIGDYAFHMDKDQSFDVEQYLDEDGEKRYRWKFHSALQNVTIGDNVTLGQHAFAGHASLKTVTLGANANIGKQAFYNCTALASIDLSKAVTIGDYAFSGDEYYVCMDRDMTINAVSKEGYYISTFHAPALTSVDLSAATSVGEYAFALCRDLVSAHLGAGVTELKQYTFAGCEALQTINLEAVTAIGDYAFMTGKSLTSVDLSAATTIGEYAFVENDHMTSVKLNPEGVTIGEGAFAYNKTLATVENMKAVSDVGDYGFAYTMLTEADLSGAENVGTQAFMKEELSPFKVTLSEKIKTLGDNPFALCQLEPFSILESATFRDLVEDSIIYNYDISETVKVIGGSLYCQVPSGLELITYCGVDPMNAVIADGTVRVTSYAFAGSDVKRVTLPYTLVSLGHKAFFGCQDLDMVIFCSYDAPILEEEFDASYFETLEHIPGSGDYGTYTDWAGQEVTIEPMNLVPYFMWNVTGGMYSNVFYGANFVDYVGYVENKLTMIRPVNGKNYDSYIYGMYFDDTLSGANAPDKTTMAAVNAINQIPERVELEHKNVVAAARAAYDKVATTEQLAMVTNSGKLISAEQRIHALENPAQPEEEQTATESEKTEKKTNTALWGVIGVIVVLLACGAMVLIPVLKNDPQAPKKWLAALMGKVKSCKCKKAQKETEEASQENTQEVTEETEE